MKRLVLGLGLVLLLAFSLNGASAASKVKPSPSPKWPPVGFTVKGEIYAKVPTVKEFTVSEEIFPTAVDKNVVEPLKVDM